MDGIGAYRVAIIEDDLKLIYLWRGKQKAKTLKQVKAGDPYFYRIVEYDRLIPDYIAFKRDESGKAISIVPGGLNECVRLKSVKKFNARTLAVPGRMVNRMSPF
jgi:hypothetical protein